jgi:hypothetical protein
MEDLLDIAVVVYVHDRIHKRDSVDLSRISKIRIPVRNPDKWNSSSSALNKALSYLMKDDVELTFSKLPGENTVSEFFVENLRPVCLFSGGADSFAGAVTLLEQGEDPILVSHYSGGILSVQRTLARNLQDHYCNATIDHFPVEVSLGDEITGTEESTQWARSFLYLSLATFFAMAWHTRRIRVFENGPVALNVPIAEGRNNTRTAHPIFLDFYRKMIAKVFGVDLDIQNPFLLLTKGEVLGRIAGNQAMARILSQTRSCWRQGRYLGLYATNQGRSSAGKSHCGTCYPCIIRAAAFGSSQLTAHDGTYVFDIRTDYPNLDEITKDTIADFLAFAKDIESRSITEISKTYSLMSVAAAGVTSTTVAEIYKRFAAEIKKFFLAGNPALRSDFASYLT